MYRDDIPGVCAGVAEELAPRLADAYDIDFAVPDVVGTRAGYVSTGTAMRYDPPMESELYRGSEAGRIKVREDWSWFHTTLTTDMAHELGHAALYQNSDFKAMRDDDSYDRGVLDTISEGVAQHFERTAHRGLTVDAAKAVDLTGAGAYALRYTVKRGTQRLWDGTLARKYPSAYSRGRATMTGMSHDRVRDVIEDPEAFYEELVAEL